jgi:hypothetical protein
MFVPSIPRNYERVERLDYLLRRAEQETIAAIRSANPRAAASHERMAAAYSAQATSMLAG